MVADSVGSIDAPSREESFFILFYFIFENDSRKQDCRVGGSSQVSRRRWALATRGG